TRRVVRACFTGSTKSPPWSWSALFGAVFVAFCWVGIFLFRPHVKDTLHQHQHLNEILANFLHYFGVLYGLLLGLLAIATYQDFADAEKGVASEASSLAALYRDI